MKFRIFLFIALLFGCSNESESPNSHSVESIRKELLNSEGTEILVIAHRGDWRNAPENSISAIENAIEMGVDMVEIDVRKTKDGELVLMHDGKIDRTTNGEGWVDEWTLDSLKTLNLRNGQGRVTQHKIPTLEEALFAAKGKVLLNLDKCYAYFDEVYELLENTGTTNLVVMKGQKPLNEVEVEFGQYLDDILFMPIVDLDKPGAATIINDYLDNNPPVAFEFIFREDTSGVIDQFEAIKQRGSRVWVNSLWASLNAGYEDDLAVQNPDSVYGWYVQKGINLIQTDRPELLINYLHTKGLHK